MPERFGTDGGVHHAVSLRDQRRSPLGTPGCVGSSGSAIDAMPRRRGVGARVSCSTRAAWSNEAWDGSPRCTTSRSGRPRWRRSGPGVRERRELDRLRPAVELVDEPGLAAGQAAVLGADLEVPVADRAEGPTGEDLADGAGGEADQDDAGVLGRRAASTAKRSIIAVTSTGRSSASASRR